MLTLSDDQDAAPEPCPAAVELIVSHLLGVRCPPPDVRGLDSRIHRVKIPADDAQVPWLSDAFEQDLRDLRRRIERRPRTSIAVCKAKE
jgi:hypothetical protein